MTYDDLKDRFHVSECRWSLYYLPYSDKVVALSPKSLTPKGTAYLGTVAGVSRKSALKHGKMLAAKRVNVA